MILFLSSRISKIEMVLAVEVTERELLEGLLVVMEGGVVIFFLLQSHMQSRKHRKLHDKTPVLRKPQCGFDRSATTGVGPEFISSPSQSLRVLSKL